MHKSGKHRSRRPPVEWGEWGTWTWSSEYGRFYRQRQNTLGEIGTEWEETASAAAAEQTQEVDETTPREPDPTEAIASGVDNLTFTESTTDNFYTTSSKSKSGKEPGSKSHSSKSKKGKAVSQGDDDESAGHETAQASHYPAAQSSSAGHYPTVQGTAAAYHDPAAYPGQETYSSSYPGSSSASSYGSSGGSHVHFAPSSHGTEVEEEEDPQMQEAIRASRSAYSDPRHGEPSTSSAPYPHEEEDPEVLAIMEQSRHMYTVRDPGEGPSTAYEYREEEEGQATPRPGSPADRIIGTHGDAELLDPRYRVQPSSRFSAGEVFKILWSEPSGNVGGTPTLSDRHRIRDSFGSYHYVAFRRFIVVASDEGHCTCVPILTYGGRGCRKKGVKPHKHGIIYQAGHRVKPLDNEPKLGFHAVRMRMDIEGEKLQKESRVNYSKLVTVEHNVKVFFIGHIVEEDFDLFSDAVNKCWADKVRHARKRGHGS